MPSNSILSSPLWYIVKQNINSIQQHQQLRIITLNKAQYAPYPSFCHACQYRRYMRYIWVILKRSRESFVSSPGSLCLFVLLCAPKNNIIYEKQFSSSFLPFNLNIIDIYVVWLYCAALLVFLFFVYIYIHFFLFYTLLVRWSFITSSGCGVVMPITCYFAYHRAKPRREERASLRIF